MGGLKESGWAFSFELRVASFEWNYWACMVMLRVWVVERTSGVEPSLTETPVGGASRRTRSVAVENAGMRRRRVVV